MCLTEKQLRILQFIQRFREDRLISPTLQEIANEFGVTKITIYEHLNQLEKKGAIKRTRFYSRSIEVLVPVEERAGLVRLLGSWTGPGGPVEAGLEESAIRVSDLSHCPMDTLAIKISSRLPLSELGLRFGDVVVFDRRAVAELGDLVLFKEGNAERIGFFKKRDRAEQVVGVMIRMFRARTSKASGGADTIAPAPLMSAGGAG